MKKISWQGILSAFFIVIGVLQLTGAILIFIRFKMLRPQNIVMGIVFLVIAIVLYKSKRAIAKK